MINSSIIRSTIQISTQTLKASSINILTNKTNHASNQSLFSKLTKNQLSKFHQHKLHFSNQTM